MNRSLNAERSSLYTAGELAGAREALKKIGYEHKPEGKFSDLLEDYVKRDASGNITGIVTFHLDPQKTLKCRTGL